MITCRVKPGMRFGKLKQFGPGDLVEIPLSAYSGFADKLERVYELAVFPSVAGEVLEGEPSEPTTDGETDGDLEEGEPEDETQGEDPEPEDSEEVPIVKRRRRTPTKTAEDA